MRTTYLRRWRPEWNFMKLVKEMADNKVRLARLDCAIASLYVPVDMALRTAPHRLA